MQKRLPQLPEAHASEGLPTSALTRRFGPAGLPAEAETRVYLRFEPLRRLGACATEPASVGVLASWRARSLACGNVDAVHNLSSEECEELLATCRTLGVRVVDNRGA